MEEKNKKQRSESEELQRKDPNPDTMAVSDEEQRQAGNERGQEKKKQMPVGNEKGKQDTDGAQAGVGE